MLATRQEMLCSPHLLRYSCLFTHYNLSARVIQQKKTIERIKRDRQTDRQTDRDTERQTDRERHRDRQTDTKKEGDRQTDREKERAKKCLVHKHYKLHKA